ncbi:hypothetical protein H671_6g15987 [Cricetulus griseus]|uniref:Uncharacterized protein n=1 Tax=Cricetulus griseus TaxID=10029 RepID=A0A061I1Y7_CRIGR|nr:hypothetical protein H671_6g15987 [Cricetulus griseus]
MVTMHLLLLTVVQILPSVEKLSYRNRKYGATADKRSSGHWVTLGEYICTNSPVLGRNMSPKRTMLLDFEDTVKYFGLKRTDIVNPGCDAGSLEMSRGQSHTYS